MSKVKISVGKSFMINGKLVQNNPPKVLLIFKLFKNSNIFQPLRPTQLVHFPHILQLSTILFWLFFSAVSKYSIIFWKLCRLVSIEFWANFLLNSPYIAHHLTRVCVTPTFEMRNEKSILIHLKREHTLKLV